MHVCFRHVYNLTSDVTHDVGKDTVETINRRTWSTKRLR